MLQLILGIIFSMGKGSSLLAGYNSMPKSKRAKYDSVALCRFTGKIFFVLAFCMVLLILGSVYEKEWMYNIGTILFMITLVLSLIYVNTGNRFKE